MYVPPFTISAKAINLIAEISAQVERYAIKMEQKDSLLLRRANRIRTIHSSLAIEGNTLNEQQVVDIVNGKNVVAPLREIQEVKNAIRTYELFHKLNPFNLDDLLMAHKVMMEALIDRPGEFRTGGVGVFGERGCVHLAPPADRVPMLMNDLFTWLKDSPDHLLIRSCVFHYEFEYIHPFIDGNGRTGRLWLSLILAKINPLFEHLPVENMIYANQQKYYDAISESTNRANSEPFIDFMLNEILKALKSHSGTNVGINVGTNRDRFVSILRNRPTITLKELAEELCLSQRQCERMAAELKKAGAIQRVGSSKNGHWEVTD
ncbi:MAG: Fic family protein [Paludibacteraceae bacterium]|nr:Fic family protein [Paludibacteraceae bacterium]